MSGFLRDLWTDLKDRRMRLWLVLGGLLLVAGIAYSATAGSNSGQEAASNNTGSAASLPAAGHNALEAGEVAAAETTYGGGVLPAGLKNYFPEETATSGGSGTATAQRNGGGAPSAKSAAPQSAPTSTSQGSGAPTTQGSGAPSSHHPAPSPPKPTAPTVEAVVRFGKAPLPKTAPTVVLRLNGSLPNQKEVLLVVKSVRAPHGSVRGSATFSFRGAAPILGGAGRCLPSSASCEALVLNEGQTAELSYLTERAEVVTYALTLVSVRQVG